MEKYFLIALLSLSYFNLHAQHTAAKWQEDVLYFKKELVKRHMNAFHHMSKEEFEKDINQLYQDVPSLKDYEVIVRLMQITAKVGDTHTNVHLPDNFKRYPIVVNWFANELYVNATQPACVEALGARLVKIDDFSLQSVNEKLASVLSQDQNEWYTLSIGPVFLMIPEILATLGIVKDHDHARFTFLDSANREITLDLKPETIDPNVSWVTTSKSQPLFRQKQNDPFWFIYLDDIQTVYVNFKKYDNLDNNSRKLFEFIEANQAKRLIVDLRLNGGGDFLKGRRQLISKIKENNQINQKGNLFVITGRRTFSAAMVNSIDFKKETNAILIGEPPGEKPNSYSENNEMKLPNSGLVISYSTRYYKFLEEDVDSFEPDVRIDPNWKDYSAGRDPVMEWIISKCKK